MKVQELLPSSKPSPSSRSARANVMDARSSDFAGALTEARRKPEPKPAEAEAPAAKKSNGAKKSKSTKDEPARSDDAVAAAESRRTNEAQQPSAAADAEPVADAEQSVEDEAEKSDESELPKVEADLSGVTVTEFVGPQVLPTAVESTDTADADGDDERVICPPNFNRRPLAAGEAETAGGEAGIPLDLDELVGFEGEDQLEGLDLEADPSHATKAPAKHPTAAVAPLATEDHPKQELRAKDDGEKPQPLPGTSEFTVAAEQLDDSSDASAAPNKTDATTGSTTSTLPHLQSPQVKGQPAAQAPAAPAPLPPQEQFVEANHPKIVTAVRGELLPHGGSMQIRLDPPELGALQVMVHMQDGVMTASFQTSNDDATKLLSHSLSQLKHVLESQGVSVEKLQVQQAPKDQQASHQNDDGQHQRDQHSDAHRQEQQRKEMLKRMWRRLANGSDPLDLVA